VRTSSAGEDPAEASCEPYYN